MAKKALARLLTALHILFGIVAIGGSFLGVFITYLTRHYADPAIWIVLIVLTALYARTILDKEYLNDFSDIFRAAPVRAFICFVWVDLMMAAGMLYLAYAPGEDAFKIAGFVILAAIPAVVLLAAPALVKWVARGTR